MPRAYLSFLVFVMCSGIFIFAFGYFVLDFNKVKTDLRVQLYIRSKASVNIGYQSSIFELICRYSQIICTEMLGGVRENYFETIKYLK